MRASMRMMAVAAMLLSLSGCLAAGSLANRGTTVDQGVGEVTNRSILLNLARASRSEPLYFVSIGSITGSGSTDVRLGAPAFTEGASLPLAARQIVSSGSSTYLDNTNSTNFQMGVYNTKAFYEGMLQPLGVGEIDLLLHQGFSREMIFYLVIDKARITPQSGQPYYLYNDPTNPTYGRMVDAIKQAMVHGLTTEMVSGQPPAGGQQPPPKGGPNAGQPSSDQAGGAPLGRTCYDAALATPDALKEFALLAGTRGPPNFCGSGQPAAASQYVSLNGQLVHIQVVFRSISAIFKYLGGAVNSPDTPPTLIDYGVPSEITPAGPLFVVRAGDDAGSCFTAVSFRGKRYCAPDNGPGAENTRRVFDILNTLVALKQSPGDLPASNALLIAP
jgi:hypothetical protein